MQALGSRAVLGLALATTLAGCGSSTTTSPSGSASPSADGAASPSANTAASSAASPSIAPSGTAAGAPGRWEPAGAMTGIRWDRAMVRLGDGRVLLVGTRLGEGGAPSTELWDPVSATWTSEVPLNKVRTSFLLIALEDGRALLTGGLNDIEQSFSSTYLFDPGTLAWTKVGLLSAARTAPGGAALQDGGALVAGGYFHVAYTESGFAPGVALAGFRDNSSRTTTRFADVDPYPVGSAMATAERFDAAAGSWSETGPMVYARVGAAMATLADGRVLVVGSSEGPFGGVAVDPGAFSSAEVYDPDTGRFSLTGSLPAIDPAAIEAQGLEGGNPIPQHPPTVGDIGTLIAFDDGGAVLIGHGEYWKNQGGISRSFRYDATSGTWTEIGETYIFVGEPTADILSNPGAFDLSDAAAAPLPDGGVLVAESSRYRPSTAAHRYDPVTSTWSDLPALSEPGASGLAVALEDGSVLVLIQRLDLELPDSAIRFVPR